MALIKLNYLNTNLNHFNDRSRTITISSVLLDNNLIIPKALYGRFFVPAFKWLAKFFTKLGTKTVEKEAAKTVEKRVTKEMLKKSSAELTEKSTESAAKKTALREAKEAEKKLATNATEAERKAAKEEVTKAQQAAKKAKADAKAAQNKHNDLLRLNKLLTAGKGAKGKGGKGGNAGTTAAQPSRAARIGKGAAKIVGLGAAWMALDRAGTAAWDYFSSDDEEERLENNLDETGGIEESTISDDQVETDIDLGEGYETGVGSDVPGPDITTVTKEEPAPAAAPKVDKTAEVVAPVKSPVVAYHYNYPPNYSESNSPEVKIEQANPEEENSFDKQKQAAAIMGENINNLVDAQVKLDYPDLPSLDADFSSSNDGTINGYTYYDVLDIYSLAYKTILSNLYNKSLAQALRLGGKFRRKFTINSF